MPFFLTVRGGRVGAQPNAPALCSAKLPLAFSRLCEMRSRIAFPEEWEKEWKAPQYRGPQYLCGPLLKEGPARLAQQYRVGHEGEYVAECRTCCFVPRALIDRFPGVLSPRQVCGLQEN